MTEYPIFSDNIRDIYIARKPGIAHSREDFFSDQFSNPNEKILHSILILIYILNFISLSRRYICAVLTRRYRDEKFQRYRRENRRKIDFESLFFPDIILRARNRLFDLFIISQLLLYIFTFIYLVPLSRYYLFIKIIINIISLDLHLLF